MSNQLCQINQCWYILTAHISEIRDKKLQWMAWSELRRSGTSSDEGLQETFYTKWESPLNIKCTVKLELASILIRDDCFWECMYFITVLCEGHVFTPVCQSFCSQRGACMVGGHVWQGVCMAGGMCGRGHAWQGSCVAGGVCVARGGAWQGVHGRGHACHTCLPPDTTRYGRSMCGRFASYWNAFLYLWSA